MTNHAALNNSMLDFLETMNCTVSVDDAWKTTVAFMRGLGASHVTNNLDMKGSNLVYLNSSPPWVGEMYLEEVYPDHDPRLTHCRTKTSPYFSGKGFWSQARNLPVRRRKFEEEAVSVGIHSVVSIPVHLPLTKDRGYVGIATDCCAAEFEKIYKNHLTMIHLGAIAAFNQIRDLTREKQVALIGLTERERECLLWLARGLHNDRIAQRMKIRPVTVEFHMVNARRKLNARTREQALVSAIQLGVVEP